MQSRDECRSRGECRTRGEPLLLPARCGQCCGLCCGLRAVTSAAASAEASAEACCGHCCRLRTAAIAEAWALWPASCGQCCFLQLYPVLWPARCGQCCGLFRPLLSPARCGLFYTASAAACALRLVLLPLLRRGSRRIWVLYKCTMANCVWYSVPTCEWEPIILKCVGTNHSKTYIKHT